MPMLRRCWCGEMHRKGYPHPRPRASATQRGYGAEWRTIRDAHLRDDPWCAACGQPATDVDHIIPRSRGGTDEPDNLQSICHACHARKTARSDGGFGNVRRG